MEANKLRHKEIVEFCLANSDEAVIKKYSRYFKEGYDAYGIDTKALETQKTKWLADWEEEMTINDYLALGDLLISTGKFEEANFAFYFIFSKKDEFTPETFKRVGKWLENGIQNWASTDVLCMMVLSVFIFDGVVQPKDFTEWTTSKSRWKRRAVPVTFVEAIKKKYKAEPFLPVIEKLMLDEEQDVQKGLGTFLREVWKKQPDLAEAFLMKWKDQCGRKIIQYATEKMDKTGKAKFKRSKK